MKNSKKKLISIICVAIVVFGAVLVHRHVVQVRDAVLEQERLIRRAYRELTFAFDWNAWRVHEAPETIEIYKPLEVEHNPFGICVSTYLLLKLYYRETGVILEYEVVVDYFSQEFEPDGSLRLYNNGKHPEIYAYVEWMRAERTLSNIPIREFGQRIMYWRRIRDIYIEYSNTHRDAGFIEHHLSELSPKMLDALARAERDSDYVLDLTSLQQAGY